MAVCVNFSNRPLFRPALFSWYACRSSLSKSNPGGIPRSTITMFAAFPRLFRTVAVAVATSSCASRVRSYVTVIESGSFAGFSVHGIKYRPATWYASPPLPLNRISTFCAALPSTPLNTN